MIYYSVKSQEQRERREARKYNVGRKIKKMEKGRIKINEIYSYTIIML